MYASHIKNTICFVSALGVLAFASPTAFSSEQPEKNGSTVELSLNSILLFALHNNPDIDIFQQRQVQAEEFMKQKKSELAPQITLSAEGGREYNDPASGGATGAGQANSTGSVSVSLQQTIFDGFQVENQVRERQKQIQSANYKTQTEIEDVINDTVETYLEIVQFQEDVRINTEFIQYIEKTTNTIQQLFEAGAVTKVMLDYARSRRAFAQTEMNRATSDLHDGLSNLEYVTGKLPPGFTAVPPEELSPDKLDLQYYIDLIQKNNSLLLANDMERKAAELRLKAERAKDLPELTFDLTADQTENSGGSVGREVGLSATVQMTYTLFDGFKNRYSKNLVKSQVKELEATRRQILKDLHREIKLSYNQFKAAEYALETTELEILANIAQKELNEENFKLGNINVIELIESAERLKTSYLKKEDLKLNMRVSAYKLLVLTGILDNNYFCETCDVATIDNSYLD